MSILHNSSNQSNQPIESVKADRILTPESKKGQDTYRILCEIVTHELDLGERDHAVPNDSKMLDLLVTQKPTSEVIERELEKNGFDMIFGWKLTSWWQPETEGYPDVF